MLALIRESIGVFLLAVFPPRNLAFPGRAEERGRKKHAHVISNVASTFVAPRWKIPKTGVFPGTLRRERKGGVVWSRGLEDELQVVTNFKGPPLSLIGRIIENFGILLYAGAL